MSTYPIAYVDILLPNGKAAKAPSRPSKSLEIKGDLKLRKRIPKVIKQLPDQSLDVKAKVNIRFVLPANSGLVWSSVELGQYDPWGRDREGNYNMPIYQRKILDDQTLEVVNDYQEHDDGTTCVWKMRLWFRKNGMLVYIDPDIQNTDQD